MMVQGLVDFGRRRPELLADAGPPIRGDGSR